MGEPLTAADYHALFEQIGWACRTFSAMSLGISDEHVDAALRTVAHAEAVGFVVDQTLYHAALYDGRLRRQAALLKAFANFRDALRAIDRDIAAHAGVAIPEST